MHKRINVPSVIDKYDNTLVYTSVLDVSIVLVVYYIYWSGHRMQNQPHTKNHI